MTDLLVSAPDISDVKGFFKDAASECNLAFSSIVTIMKDIENYLRQTMSHEDRRTIELHSKLEVKSASWKCIVADPFQQECDRFILLLKRDFISLIETFNCAFTVLLVL